MERETIENIFKGQITALIQAKSVLDRYIVEFQEIDKELREDKYNPDRGSYTFAIRYDKSLVVELTRKLKNSMRNLKRLEKDAENSMPLLDMHPRPWGVPKLEV